MPYVPGFALGFVVVAGWALLRWWLHGRDPVYTDDDSILLAAPPEGMTAAVATIIDGGPAPTAFLAALLDLASRDEIGFRDETPGARGPHRIGIEIHGGPSEDPRVNLNRRRPIGEGEAWMRGALRATAAAGRPDLGVDDRRALAFGAMASVVGMAMGGASRPNGFAPAPGADAMAGLEGAMLGGMAREGHEALASLVREGMDDPEAVEAAPAAFAARLEAVTGKPVSAEQVAMFASGFRQRRDAVERVEAGPSDPSHPDYLSGHDALAFHAPIGFGTLLENYARRQGWIAGLSFAARWRWRGVAALELLAGASLAAVAGSTRTSLVGAGLGVLAGGLVTWWVAPHMATRTGQGALVRAQVGAYRRTLKATFDSSATLDDAVASSRLRWLETPDQALVWGVALGLRPEIEALLARTRRGIDAGTVDRGAFLPRWVGRVADGVRLQAGGAEAGPVAAPGAQVAGDGGEEDVAAVFAGIERIGSVPNPHGGWPLPPA